ncbi:hypothetical protein [Planctomyces sp. SH-PL62]|uniref:hypothetical protein n=1 Tax=Planctomyces sp. SH-PL62 TaxID=1636152 RepID=UPI000839764D|nr:hypothetical protein [Planctomyces sp. SH-PL62]
MMQPSGAFILRAIRIAYGASIGLALVGAFGGWYYWPGALAWISIFLAVVALLGGLALTQLLSRLRLILWLLPIAERLRAILRERGQGLRSDADRRRR